MVLFFFPKDIRFYLETESLQVTRKHFKDLAYVRFSGESSSQELVVYTDSEIDKDSLLVRHITSVKNAAIPFPIKCIFNFSSIRNTILYVHVKYISKIRTADSFLFVFFQRWNGSVFCLAMLSEI